MAARRTTFGKLERERAKKAKAAAKRGRREERAGLEGEEEEAPEIRLSQAEALERLSALHARFDQGVIDFEGFEKEKEHLLANLPME